MTRIPRIFATNHKAAIHPILISILGVLSGIAFFFILNFPVKYAVVGLFAILAPLLALIFGQWKRFFLILLILGIPLQVKKTLFGYTLYHIGGPGGIDLMMADCALLALYAHWLYKRMVHRNEKTFHYSKIEFLILVSILIHLVSLLNAADFTLGVIDLTRILKITLLYLYLANNIKETRELKLILYMLFVGLLIHNIISLGQYWLQRPLGFSFLGEVVEFEIGDLVINRQVRPSGTMQGANTSALFLVSVLPFVFTSLFWIKGRAGIAFSLLTFTSGLLVLILTLSRGGWVGFFVSLLVLLYFAIKKNFITFRLNFHYCLLALFFAVIFVMIFSPKIIDRLFHTSPIPISTRAFLNRTALAMIYDHPFIGIGLNNFQETAEGLLREIPDPKNVYRYVSKRSVVHNLYLLIAAETGLFGIIIFLAIFYLIIKKALFIVRADDPLLSTFGIAYVGFVLGFLTSELFDFSYRLDAVFYLFWALAGLTIAANRIQNASDQRK